MYFVPFERDIQEYCVQYNDGTCDNIMNTPEYKFDGGDCCAATCLESNCGNVSAIDVFDTSINSGISFPYCSDPAMLPITVRLDIVNITGEADLSINCDERVFLSVTINEDMENKYETIMVSYQMVLIVQ